MSKLKYFNSLNLFEGILDEYEVGNPVQELGIKLGQLFQQNPPLLKSVMNRLRSYPPEVQKQKINIALRTVNDIINHDPYEISQAIFRALDDDDKVNKFEPTVANEPAAQANNQRRQFRK